MAATNSRMISEELLNLDWIRIFNAIRNDKWAMSTAEFDDFMREKWGVDIERDRTSSWDDITSFSIDPNYIPFMLLAYPVQPK